jgi:hypothetical protein
MTTQEPIREFQSSCTVGANPPLWCRPLHPSACMVTLVQRADIRAVQIGGGNILFLQPKHVHLLHQCVAGTVKVKLYKGNVIVMGRKSPYSLYDKVGHSPGYSPCVLPLSCYHLPSCSHVVRLMLLACMSSGMHARRAARSPLEA